MSGRRAVALPPYQLAVRRGCYSTSVASRPAEVIGSCASAAEVGAPPGKSLESCSAPLFDLPA
eukprot:12430974-Alexandrium_andersonii.AAC.1